MKEAMYYQKLDEGKVRCELCPKRCIVAPDGYGFCHARKNVEGKFFSEIYATLKPTGKFLILEPKGHVSEKDFKATISATKKNGFIVIDSPQTGVRVVLLQKEE